VEGQTLSEIRIDWGLLTTVLAVQLPLMIAFPIFLGFAIRRRLQVPMSVWLIGAGAFVVSQLVHLPLNFALGLIGPPRGVALLPRAALGAVAGLSAGVCEETARWLAMRFLMKDERSWRSAVQFGAGHGGIEAILFGGLVLLNLVNVLLAPHAASLGLSADDQAALRHGARQFWQAPPLHAALGGYERLCAMSFHIGASTLVLLSLVKGRLRYLFVAILLHAAMNFPIVYVQDIGIGPFYLLLTVFAAIMLVVCWRVRRELEPS
jgi:uncharacterized membrane protein YhfC